MKFEKLTKTVNEKSMEDEVFNFAEELFTKNFDVKAIKGQLKKKFKHLSKEDIDLIVQVF